MICCWTTRFFVVISNGFIGSEPKMNFWLIHIGDRAELRENHPEHLQLANTEISLWIRTARSKSCSPRFINLSSDQENFSSNCTQKKSEQSINRKGTSSFRWLICIHVWEHENEKLARQWRQNHLKNRLVQMLLFLIYFYSFFSPIVNYLDFEETSSVIVEWNKGLIEAHVSDFRINEKMCP